MAIPKASTQLGLSIMAKETPWRAATVNDEPAAASGH
jgi:hypothetical protein